MSRCQIYAETSFKFCLHDKQILLLLPLVLILMYEYCPKKFFDPTIEGDAVIQIEVLSPEGDPEIVKHVIT